MTREEAISILKQYIDYNNPDVTDFYTMEEAIEAVIKALEHEPCTDAISREDALMALTGEWKESRDEILSLAIRRIRVLPSVTPTEKVGRWIIDRCDMYICSKCNHTYTDLSGERYGMNFCPNCGQPKMQEAKE